MTKQEEAQSRLLERTCKTRSVGELMEILFRRLQENGGVIDVGDFVYVPTPHGTVVYPRAEYDMMKKDERNNTDKFVSDTNNH